MEHLIASLVLGLVLTSWIWIGWIPRRWTFAAAVAWALIVDRAGRYARALAASLIASVPLLAGAVVLLHALHWIENW